MSEGRSSIQPVALVGGRSRRFGRDKLREALATCDGAEDWLIDRPIAALRSVFGPRVALVGDCSAEVARRADMHWPDDHPGAGPAGGVLTALERAERDVFVLSGDLPNISETSLRHILDAAARASPDVWAILAKTTRVEPCIGLYRQSMAQALADRVRPPTGAPSLLRLHDAAPPHRLLLVDIDPREALNINTISDLLISIDSSAASAGVARRNAIV